MKRLYVGYENSEDAASVEHEVMRINAEYGTDLECFWAEEKG